MVKAWREQLGAQADARLLEHFVVERDESTFEELMRRHGSMVLAVGRRILKNQADAEEAFKATILAR